MPNNIVSQQENTVTRSALNFFGEQGYRFGLGVIAGICGTMVVFPIDSVKTRIQNQRNATAIGKAPGSMMYDGYLDCFNKVRLLSSRK